MLCSSQYMTSNGGLLFMKCMGSLLLAPCMHVCKHGYMYSKLGLASTEQEVLLPMDLIGCSSIIGGCYEPERLHQQSKMAHLQQLKDELHSHICMYTTYVCLYSCTYESVVTTQLHMNIILLKKYQHDFFSWLC